MAGKKPDFSVPTPKADCAHEGCRQPALVRMHRETGWANLCEYHYVDDHRKRAESWCKANGLETRQQRIEYCRKMIRGVFPSIRAEREPGQDDEERAA